MDVRGGGPIGWVQDREGGVVALVLDAPDSPVNTITVGYVAALDECVTRLERIQDTIEGVVIRSAKATFLAGGDLNRLMAVEPEGVADFVADLDYRKSITRRLELLRCPVVAVINGSVLGGGLELALCCHHSIAIDDPRAVAGLPEAAFGLIPGAGGIVRVVDRLGTEVALDEVILPGAKFGIRKAVELGLIDAVATSVGEADRMARAWMAEHRADPRRVVVRPPSEVRLSPGVTAVPTGSAITAVANEVLSRDFDAALHVESVALGAIVTSRGVKNSIQINFFDSARLRKAARGLSGLPADGVYLVPSSAAVRPLVESVAVSGRVLVCEEVPGFAPPVGADAYIRLEGVPVEAWPTVWIVGDTVGDGQWVVEYCSDGSGRAFAAIAALAGAGLVPVPVVGGRSVCRVSEVALGRAIDARRADGVDDERIAAALAWAGLRSVPSDLPEGVLADPGEVDLACGILDELAQVLVEHLGAGSDDLHNVISVRAGGFPSWTGGARAWIEDGAALARELSAVDVAEVVAGAGRR